MLIEAILAGFLAFGLPPATTPVKACTNWSKRVGCATNSGGGREQRGETKEALDHYRSERRDVPGVGRSAGKGGGKGKGGRGGHGK